MSLVLLKDEGRKREKNCIARTMLKMTVVALLRRKIGQSLNLPIAEVPVVGPLNPGFH